ncbi:MAG: hypothetical protein OFPII_19830 [Osedax symbiont Rs1]|nr:MAG: hypothetical protein OFPII_19830 [Osedax symbiont Rs1]
MFGDLSQQNNHQVLDRRKIAIGCLAVILIVTGGAVNFSYQIIRIAKGYDSLIENSIAAVSSCKTIKFKTIHINSMLLHLLDLSEVEEIDEIIALIGSNELLIVKEYQSLLAKPSALHDIFNVSFQQFNNLRAVREKLYQLKMSGKIEESHNFYRVTVISLFKELQTAIELIEVRLQQEVVKSQIENTKKSNKILWTSLFVSILAIIFVIILMWDIWLSIVSNERLRSRRQALIDSNILIAILDKNGQIEDVSSALCKLLGCSKDELLGSATKFFLEPSKSSKLLENDILNLISQGKEWYGEISYIKHDGEKVWAESSIVPNYDEQFNISGYTNILHDLTSKKLAGIDQLTNLLNRRSYDQTLTDQVSIAVRNKYPISLAILDIDYFKRFNDLYGHPEGDVALKALSDLLTRCMQRPNDYVFRIGGEEFAILISGLDTQKTTDFLYSIKEQVKALKIPNKNSSICPYLTVSVGAVVLLSGSATEQQLYETADRALYDAKIERDSVVVCSFIEEPLK